jgi:hypothetical protein
MHQTLIGGPSAAARAVLASLAVRAKIDSHRLSELAGRRKVLKVLKALKALGISLAFTIQFTLWLPTLRSTLALPCGQFCQQRYSVLV